MEDGSTVAERLLLDKEIAEVKGKFNHTRVFALRRKYLRLIKKEIIISFIVI